MAAEDELRFSNAETSGYPTLLTFLVIAVLFESIPAHFLIGRWSRPVAWVCTAVSAYALFWLAAAIRSFRSRPVLVSENMLILQLGSLWRVEIPRTAIVSLSRMTGSENARRQPGTLSLVKWNTPQWQLIVNQPVLAFGAYGFRKPVTKVTFSVDEPSRFERAVAVLMRHE